MNVTYDDNLCLHFAVREQPWKTFSRYLTKRFAARIQANMWNSTRTLPPEGSGYAITIHEDDTDYRRIFFVWCGKTYIIRLWESARIEDDEAKVKIIGYAQCWWDKETDDEIDAMPPVQTHQPV